MNRENGVSTVIGAVILVVLVIILSVGVLFTAQTLIDGQPQDVTAGTTDERADFYTHEAQLVNRGNTDTVYAVSPLGTEYKLEDAGDLQKILPLEKGSHYGVDQYQVIGEKDGDRQLLKTQHFENGVEPDVVVHDDGDKDYETIQAAINNIEDDTERDLSANDPGVIVVQKGVYTENIEVSDNIQLIAEYGAVIQDANPNEDVVDIRGDNVRVQNFDVDGDPNQDEDQHYARHGINIRGDSAVVQGNTIYNADSPDVKSAGIKVNGDSAKVRFNNVHQSEESVRFGEDSAAPAVCGNQFENGIGGYLTQETQGEIATMNHWEEGVPVNLAQTVLSEEDTDVEEGDELTLPGEAKSLVQSTNSKVPADVLGEEAGRAALPFTGTKIVEGEESTDCEVSVELVNTGKSIELKDIVVEIQGRETTIEVVQEVDLGDSESSDERDQIDDGPVAVCNGCDDGIYDEGDSITLQNTDQTIFTYSDDAEAEPLPFTEGDGYEPTPSSFNIQGTSTTPTTTVVGDTCEDIYGENADTCTDDNDDGTQSDDGGDDDPLPFKITLGSKLDIQLADEVSLTPIVTGSEGDIKYEWDLGDGTTSTEEQVTHMYEDPGTYTVELTVTDTATGETDTDTTEVTVEEGKKDVEQIRSDEQERLADLVQEDVDGEGKVLYLEDGITYDQLNEIGASDLTIIGSGDDVTLDGPIVVQASGVTFKNVHIDGPLVVQNDDFGFYNSKVTNPSGYAIEINANGNNFNIGSSTLDGANGLYTNVDQSVTVSDSTITATDQYGIYTGRAIDGFEIRDTTIDSADTGVYENLATSPEYNSGVTFDTEVQDIEEEEATPPTISNISTNVPYTDVTTGFSASITDPDGFGIKEITWQVDSTTETVSPSETFRHKFDEPGEYTVTVTATDRLGTTTQETTLITVQESEVSLTTAETASQGDRVTANVNHDLPDHRIDTITYDWGDGTTDTADDATTATHRYSEMGTHTVEVTVNPVKGESMTATEEIEIVDSPVAEFNIEEDKYHAGTELTFNGEYSTAPEGKDLTYEWSLGDGTTATGETVSHTYPTTGTYTVTLTVTDSDGFTDTMKANVQVDTFKTTVNGPTKLAYNEAGEFTIDTSIEDEHISHINVDANGDGQRDATYQSAPFTHNFDREGIRTVTINVVDDNGGIGQDTIEVDVADAYDFDLTASTDQAGYGDTVTFDVENENYNGATYEWDFDDGTTTTTSEGTVTHTMKNSLGSRVSVTAITSDGIKNTESIIIGGTDVEYTVSTQQEFEQAIQEPGALVYLEEGNQFAMQDMTADGVRIIGNNDKNELVIQNGPVTLSGDNIALDNIHIQHEAYNDMIRTTGDNVQITESYIQNTYNYDNGYNTVRATGGSLDISNSELYNNDAHGYALRIQNDATVDINTLTSSRIQADSNSNLGETQDIVADMYHGSGGSFDTLDAEATSGQTIEVTDSYMKLVEQDIKVNKRITRHADISTNNLQINGDGTNAYGRDAELTVTGDDVTFDNVHLQNEVYHDLLTINAENTEITNSYIYNTYNYDNGYNTIRLTGGEASFSNTEIYNSDAHGYALRIQNNAVFNGEDVTLHRLQADSNSNLGNVHNIVADMYHGSGGSFDTLDYEAESGQTIEITNSHMRLVEQDIKINKRITRHADVSTNNLQINGDGTNALGRDSELTITGDDITLDNVYLKNEVYHDLLTINAENTEITNSYIYNTYNYDNGYNTIRLTGGDLSLDSGTKVYNNDAHGYALRLQNDAVFNGKDITVDRIQADSNSNFGTTQDIVADMYRGSAGSFDTLDSEATDGQTIKVTDSYMKLVEQNIKVNKRITQHADISTSNLQVNGDGTNALGRDVELTVKSNGVTFDNVHFQNEVYHDLLTINAENTEITNSYIHNTYNYDNGYNTIRIVGGELTTSGTEVYNNDAHGYALRIQNNAVFNGEDLTVDRIQADSNSNFGNVQNIVADMYRGSSGSLDTLDAKAETGQTIEVTNSYMKLVEQDIKVNKRITQHASLSTSNLQVNGDGTNALSRDVELTVTGDGITFDNIHFQNEVYGDLLTINAEDIEITNSYIHNTYGYDYGYETLRLTGGETSITSSEIYNNDPDAYAILIQNDAIFNGEDLTVDRIQASSNSNFGNVQNIVADMYHGSSGTLDTLDYEAEAGQTIEITNSHTTLVEQNIKINKRITRHASLSTSNLQVNGDGTNALSRDVELTITGDGITLDNVHFQNEVYGDLLTINAENVEITSSYIHNTYGYDYGYETIRLTGGETSINSGTEVYNNDPDAYALLIQNDAVFNGNDITVDRIQASSNNNLGNVHNIVADMYHGSSGSLDTLDYEADSGETIEVTDSYMKLVEENIKVNKRITRHADLSTSNLQVNGDGTNAYGRDVELTVDSSVSFDNVRFKNEVYGTMMTINGDVDISNSYIHNTYDHDYGYDTIRVTEDVTSISDSEVYNNDPDGYAIYVYDNGDVNLTNVQHGSTHGT